MSGLDDTHSLAIACKNFLLKNHESIRLKFRKYLLTSPYFNKAKVNNNKEFMELLAYIQDVKKIKNVYYLDEEKIEKGNNDGINPDTLAEYHENLHSIIVYKGFNKDKFCKSVRNRYILSEYGKAVMVHELCHHFFAERKGKFLALVQLCMKNILTKAFLKVLKREKRNFNEGLADLVAKYWYSKYVIFYRKETDFVFKRILGRK
jgi:hypothetical protein